MSYLRFHFDELYFAVDNFFRENSCKNGGNVVIL